MSAGQLGIDSEQLDVLAALRAEFPGWWFSLIPGRRRQHWDAHRAPESPRRVIAIQAADPEFLRALLHEVEKLEGRWPASDPEEGDR